MAKIKSLSVVAKSVLMKESNDPTPDRDAKLSTPNKETLHPNSGSVPQEPDPKHNEAQLVADAPKAPGEGDNVGASAAAPVGKDTSKSGQKQEGEKFGLKEDDDFEISEELQAFIDAMVAEGKTDDEIADAISENFEIVDEDGEVDVHEAAQAVVAINKEKLKEHVDALLEGESLSEEFRSKATTIFEAALDERLNEEVAILEAAYTKALEERVAEIHEALKKRTDDYLNYVVEQWVIENQVALDSGLRNELTEEFISGLRSLFLEHYIDVPEDKVDVVESLGNQVTELTTKLNEEIERNVELKKTLNESKSTEILSKLTEGLTTTQAEKLKSLAENVEFVDPATFESKVKTLKESYFPTGAPKATATIDNEPDAGSKKMISESTDRMSKYVRVLGKNSR
eukprot:gnl/Spiro4/14530_TR7831_c0_g1_i1.p2 gnl/Spiro4/14530_TR7831_c0_g1~~gnl/Spiro4/14530_TR7831_c0_g1_i1.p2  ORF type:complete len:400 (-),score=68.33 gnl/Spiro4/14530_TR7831_c0_g1_i1:5693-6892(-)